MYASNLPCAPARSLAFWKLQHTVMVCSIAKLPYKFDHIVVAWRPASGFSF